MTDCLRNLKSFLFIIAIVLSIASYAQAFQPAVSLQTGFNDQNTEAYFRFSHFNHYIYGYNDIGEYILWEVRSGRQIKKINPIQSVIPTFWYKPYSSFSNDERLLLIPDYPKGNYFLYDVKADTILYTFHPAAEEERYTHAFFSSDGSKILLLAQVGGDNPYCRVQIKDVSGKLLNSWILNVPKPVDGDKLILKLLMNRILNAIKAYPLITAITVTPDLRKIWFTSSQASFYSLDLSAAPKEGELSEQNYNKITVAPYRVTFDDLNLYNNKIIAKEESHLEKLKNKNYIKRDSLFVINTDNGKVEKRVVSNYLLFSNTRRSNDIPASPVATAQSMNSYLQMADATDENATIICKDVLTDQELFRYKSGEPFFWYTKGDYKEGQLNGGFVTAISDDRSLMAETTRDFIVHDVQHKTIKTLFPLLKGNLKLNAPLFIDSNRLLIPKVYNDAFVMDLSNCGISRVKREIDCQDTARNGANVYFPVVYGAQVGLENRCLSGDKRKIGLINYIPNDLCNPKDNKTIEIYDSRYLQKIAQYDFHDPEFSFYFSMIEADTAKFLVNYKLVSFANAKPDIKDLKIVQKKDTFLAIHPMYLSSCHCIFSILGTRDKPGDPDLIFAKWNLDGKLLESFRYERKKSKLDFQMYINESQLSPDSTKLLFGLYDGTAGVFDIPKMKVINTVEHGYAFESKLLKIYAHTDLLSGVFLDNDTFITNGNDGLINIWSVTQNKLLRTINKEPVVLYSMCLSPDKKYIVGTDMNKSVVFVNALTGEVDMRFIAFDYESYALIGKNGYYTSNKRANNSLSFLYGGKSYEFSQFDLTLNRPDKLMEQLGYAKLEEIQYYRKAYEKRLNKLGFSPGSVSAITQLDAPELHLESLPDNTRETSSPILTFAVSATAPSSVINRLFITVNGVPLYGAKGKGIKQPGTNKTSIPVSIPLSFGKNRIEISVMDNKGVESLKEYLSITRTGVVIKPDLYLISIGSGRFAQAQKNLKYPAKDAHDVTDIFKDENSRFGKIVPFLLQDEKVTKANIYKLKDQLKNTKPDDYVILFYAGHGILDKKLDYYLSTYNVDFTNPETQAIPYQNLSNLLDSIPARNKVMLLDACHSGEIDKESVKEYYAGKTGNGDKVFRTPSDISIKETKVGADNSFKLMQSLFSDLRQSSGASVIAAAGPAEYAVEGDKWQNGIFTYCLRKGLKEKEADVNKDGKIYLSELLEYMQKEVFRSTDGNQQPVSRAENLVNDILIWN